MTDDPRIRKQLLRQRLRAATKCPVEDAKSASGAVCRALLSLPAISEARALCAYVSAFADEPDIGDVIEHFHQSERPILLPRFDGATGAYRMVEYPCGARLERGYYGIPEPASDWPDADESLVNAESTPWCIPGMAFDRNGNRLGRGGGWYDRLLTNRRGTRIGVAFASRLLESTPAEAHDISMDAVVTEREAWFRQPAGRGTPCPMPTDERT